MNGTIGIIYNKDLVDEPVNSWDIMWNEKYKKSNFCFRCSKRAYWNGIKS